jgi:hypothetical protein
MGNFFLRELQLITGNKLYKKKGLIRSSYSLPDPLLHDITVAHYAGPK